MKPNTIPEYKMVQSMDAGCNGCDFRYMREIKCSQIDCRPRNGVPVIAKIIDKKINPSLL